MQFGLLIFALLVQDLTAACRPAYHLTYAACIHRDSPVRPTAVETEWIRVQGASEDACLDHAKELAKESPTTTGVSVIGMDFRPSPTGGKDLFCRYSLPAGSRVPTPSAACGVVDVERRGCDGITADFVRACLTAPEDGEHDLWRKAGCLVDSHNEAMNIVGMDSVLFSQVNEALNRLLRSAANSRFTSASRLRDHIASQKKDLTQPMR